MISVRTAEPGEIDLLVALDDSASSLYTEAGFELDLPPTHPLCVAERERWLLATEEDRALVAFDASEPDQLLGFATMGLVDGAHYLDQLSVGRGHMRRGIGTLLLEHCLNWARARPFGPSPLLVLLTTYSHLSFNRPFYERFGFTPLPETERGPELRAILDEQRRFLPAPEQRIAMWKTL